MEYASTPSERWRTSAGSLGIGRRTSLRWSAACLLEEFRHNDEILFLESPVLCQPVHLKRKTPEGHGRVLQPGLAFYDTQVLDHVLQRKLCAVVRPQDLRDLDCRVWRPHAAQGYEELLDQGRLK